MPEQIEFYPLLEGRGKYTFEQFVRHYTEFLEKMGKPDLILATAYPIMILVARMAAIRLGRGQCKVVSWLHGPLERYVAAGYGGVECLDKADGIFVLNRKTENIIRNYHADCNIAIVKNPVDFRKYPIQTKGGWECRTLLFVGRLAEEKRIDIILHALSQTKEPWKLIVIGDGEEGDKLKDLTKKLHIEQQVTFLGWKKEPWEYAEGISASVLASEYEAFPAAVIESLASGIPVISTPVDGVVEIIKPGINGLLYPDGDSAGLAAILDVCASGKFPPLDSQICRRSVEDHDEKKALSEFLDKLEDILADRSFNDHEPVLGAVQK